MEMGMGEQCKDRWHTVAGSVNRASHCPGCGMSRFYWEHGSADGTRGQYEDAIVEAYELGYAAAMGVASAKVLELGGGPIDIPEDLE